MGSFTRAPFFVIGSPRSGTTLLRLMLTSHPRFVVPPECGFVIWLHPTFGAWNAEKFADPANRSYFVTEVLASRKFATWLLSFDEIENAITGCRPQSYGEACACIYRLFCAKSGKKTAVWGDKNNYYLNHIATLKSIFPLARFIHIVRDGRDIACSYREVMSTASSSPYRPSLPIGISDIAAQWSNDIQTIGGQFKRLGDKVTFVLRYEDLTANPELELTRVCDWMGVPYSPEMLQFHVANRAHQLEPAEMMDWKPRTLDPINQDTVGRHASLLSQEEIAKFIEVAETELHYHAYLPDPGIAQGSD